MLMMSDAQKTLTSGNENEVLEQQWNEREVQGLKVILP